jgi:type I restriction enzyme S subunit
MSELPKGWVNAKLSDVTIPFETMDPTRLPDDNFEYIDIGSIDNKTQTIRDPKSFLGRDAPSRARRVVHIGDVLFSTVRTYLKNIAMVPETFDGMLTSTGIAVLRPGQAVDGRYLFNWVKSDDFIATMSSAQDGTLYPAVADKDVSGALIPLPPLPEQKRIVAKVDGLTARTARARTDLARIPTLIARYKQRLLALAFSSEGLPQVPLKRLVNEGLIGLVRSKNEQSTVEGVPYIRMQHYDLDGQWNAKDLTFVKATQVEASRFALRKGDLLFNTRNSAELVGKVALCPEEVEGYLFNNNILRLRFTSDISPEFAFRQMQAPVFRAHLEGQKSATTSVAALYQRNLYQTPLWVPPIEEQIEITRRIESAFNWLDHVAADHDAASKLLPKLDASILAKAFRGELVPQDPNDEPASALLEHIQAERATAPKQVRVRQKRVPKQPENVIRLHRDDELFEVDTKTSGASAMTKSRQDDDVMGQPYLAGLIKKGSAGTVQDLFKASDLPVADFYKQLAWEIEHKHIRDDDEKLEAL